MKTSHESFAALIENCVSVSSRKNVDAAAAVVVFVLFCAATSDGKTVCILVAVAKPPSQDISSDRLTPPQRKQRAQILS